MIVTAPKLSAAGSFLISILCLASFFVPKDNPTVTTNGKEFGTVETVTANANKTISLKENEPCNTPTINKITTRETAIIPSCFANCSNLICKGVLTVFVVCNEVAIFPNSVFIPVPVTTLFPLPYVTTVPIKAIFS